MARVASLSSVLVAIVNNPGTGQVRLTCVMQRHRATGHLIPDRGTRLVAPPFRTDTSWLKPGMIAPRSGLYRVYHYAHRAPHEVMIAAGTVLPKCRGCADKVQFAPLISGEPLEQDRDLAASDSTAA